MALSCLTGVTVTKMDLKNLKHRGGGPEKLQGAVAYLPKPIDTGRLKSVLVWALHEAGGDGER